MRSFHLSSSTNDHYDGHLAPIYAWSTGGAEAAIADGERWLATLPALPSSARVVDLGAGFGATAIPLARAGHRVTAVDNSVVLLRELSDRAAGLPVATVEAELVAFLREHQEPAELILCVGDTLPHLSSQAEVEALVEALARALAPGGLAVFSYRPRRELTPDQRFILVRADARRTLTAFLEPIDDAHQIVWDIIHERDDTGAVAMRVSGYKKLRLDPAWVAALGGRHGLTVEDGPSHRGMVVQLLRRPAP